MSRVNFNPHSRKGSDKRNHMPVEKERNFNPHSRKGSDADVKELDPYSIISIHTPARGVTKLLLIVLFSA